MQNNFTTFRPEIKDVKIKKVELICDTPTLDKEPVYMLV